MLRRLAVLVAALIAGACSGPPTTELQQADNAIVAAKAADADVYAHDELAAALAARKQYDDAVGQKDYKQALNFALQARDGAFGAAKTAAEQKAAAVKDAGARITELEGLVKTATSRLNGTGARLAPAAAERVRAIVKSAPALLEEARGLVGSHDYKKAIAKLTPAIEDLKKDLAPSRPGPPRTPSR